MEKKHTRNLLNRLAQKQVIDDTSILRVNALGSAYRKEQWQQIEKTVDLLLEDCIKLIRARIEAHTIAIFSHPRWRVEIKKIFISLSVH